MNFCLPLLLLMPLGDVGTPRDKGKAVRVPEVSGVMATRVRFSDAASQRVAEASLAVLASCHHAHVPNQGPMPDWDDFLLDCRNKKIYLHVRFPEAQEVNTPMKDDKKVRVTEMIIVLRGGVRVRTGDKAREFGKYEHDKVIRFQQALREAEPVK